MSPSLWNIGFICQVTTIILTAFTIVYAYLYMKSISGQVYFRYDKCMGVFILNNVVSNIGLLQTLFIFGDLGSKFIGCAFVQIRSRYMKSGTHSVFS